MSRWNEQGIELMTLEQRKLFNSACGTLSKSICWHGTYLSPESWRHFISATVMNMESVPTIDVGDGRHGLYLVGESSNNLTKTQAADAITLAFMIGDHPKDQKIDCPPVVWDDVVYLARRIPDNER